MQPRDESNAPDVPGEAPMRGEAGVAAPVSLRPPHGLCWTHARRLGRARTRVFRALFSPAARPAAWGWRRGAFPKPRKSSRPGRPPLPSSATGIPTL